MTQTHAKPYARIEKVQLPALPHSRFAQGPFLLRGGDKLPTIRPLKTLHRYLTGQIIASLLMTVAVFTFVLLLGNALKEILPLLISGRVSFGIVGKAIALLIPFVWVFALPMGMLTATLLIFGRFSADQELTAVRASGVSLLSLVSPVLMLSLVLCALSAWINMQLGPQSRVAYKGILFDLRAEFSSAQLPEARPIRDWESKGYIFYIGKNKNGDLRDIIVYMLRDKTNVTETVRAPRGLFEVDNANERIKLTLYNGRLVTLDQNQDRPVGIMSFDEIPLELDMSSSKREQKVKLGELTFSQLRQELQRVEQSLNLKLPNDSRQLAAIKAELRRQKEDIASPIRFQMHRQIAFSFACFGFTLMGIPLGIRVHRRETNVGIAVALILVAVYYGMVLLASALDSRPEFYPHLLVWVPNFLFQAGGAVLLWKANRGI